MNVVALARYALALSSVAAALSACSKTDASNAAAGASPAASAPAAPIVPAAMRSWPGFVAIDYGKPGQPNLSGADATRIRRVLARVKPCQRALVRYAFPGRWAQAVMFFAIPPDGGAHVFGEGDAYYVPNQDSVIPIPGDSENFGEIEKQGLQWDIDHQPCAPAGASLFTVTAGDTSPDQIRVAVHPSATIYRVSIACVALFVRAPAGIDDSTQPMTADELSLWHSEERPFVKVAGGESYLQPLESCVPFEVRANKLLAGTLHLGERRGAARYVVVVAYSAPGTSEQYAPIALIWSGSHNGVDSWISDVPSSALRRCCVPALISILKLRVEKHRR
jgi:hypothetical protein